MRCANLDGLKDLANETSQKKEFLDITKNGRIETLLQPIISLRDGNIFGFEALSRGPKDSIFYYPDTLFSYAEKHHLTWDLELACRSKALKKAGDLGLKTKLFLNVSPNIMQDTNFSKGFTKEYLDSISLDPKNIIFEITEREAANSISNFTHIVNNYKDQNYMIAIDDAGAGYSGLNLISDVKPDFIKLDMKLIRDIHKDVTKQSLVKSMKEYCSLTNTLLIAEGIETEEELIKLIELGVHYGQGYYIQKPSSCIYPLAHHLKEQIKESNRKVNHFQWMKPSDLFIEKISKPVMSISPNMPVAQVFDLMQEDSLCHGFCITEGRKVVGVITKGELFRRVSGRYGYPLYQAKPIRSIMAKEFLVVDHETTVSMVSKKAMLREPNEIYDFITVTKDDDYYGVVTVKDLLEKTIELEVSNAKHMNPLTELPGNILIEQELQAHIIGGIPAYILYFDIDNFKPYNDVYGFENGDRVIQFFADLLKNHIDKNDFLGHIGGDDFVAVIHDLTTNIEKLLETLVKKFEEKVIFFYNQKDMDNGYIVAKNRHGIKESYPLLTFSSVCIKSEDYKTLYSLSQDIGRFKKECKQIPGNCSCIANKDGKSNALFKTISTKTTDDQDP